MNSSPSLEALSSRPESRDRPGRRLPAWSIPAGILLGIAILFLALFGDRLLPAPRVEVAIVLATPADAKNAPDLPAATAPAPGAGGNALFQASGWIEPAPYPVKAASLVDGVVDEVHVLAGQVVKEGDLLATLIPEDAKLALATAEQQHRMAMSNEKAQQAAVEAARKKSGGLAAQVRAAETLRDEASDWLKRVGQLSGRAVSESEVVSARLRVAREESQYLTAVSAVDEIQAEIGRLEAESLVRSDETRAAALEVDKAKLALSRTRIVAPIGGRILRLLAAPGQKKMLEDLDHDSSTIAILYQPESIQVRVDIPLADAAGLRIGQPVRIRCGLLPEKVFRGKVTLVSGEADLQRNTLQAKVSVDDPVDELRPEMLCRVEFLAPPTTPGGGITPMGGSLSTWVPEAAVADGAVWVCDPESKRVSRRAVTPSAESREGYLRLSEGPRPGEWVVLSPRELREGKRVTPQLVEK